ncbi:polysaccharide biosynthesis protein [Methanocaldococcus villosus KIN24-T80]|uniref:Polysaccharide biosynthesis protein n=1 Tax=Methanocaldococcus villosus KIN24-T80 TaxID=1069083 RepID=N6UV33_9EURY|nr:oligosaccharide flippase family protein [Methanocaldococcus villosus]ENN96224.1 polysaccharide biosynthesis protein [Methanocaldococcus villosus KIN24-T80]
MLLESLILTFFNFSSGFFNYLYQLFMGKLLTPEEYGVVASLLSIFLILGIFPRVINSSLTPQISKLKAKNRLNEINYIFLHYTKRFLILGVIITIIFLILSPLISNFLHIKNIYTIIILLNLPFIFINPINLAILQGLQRFTKLGFTNTLTSLAKFLFGILLVYLTFGVFGALIAILLSSIISYLVSLYFIRDILKLKPKEYFIKNFYKTSKLIFLIIFSYTTITTVDVILAKHYLSKYLAGIYSSVSTLGKIIFFLPGGIQAIILSKAIEYKEKNLNHLNLLKKSIIFLILLTLPILTSYIFFPELVIKVLFSKKYLLAKLYIGKYGLAMLLFSISGLIMNYLISLNVNRIAYPLILVLIFEILAFIIFPKTIDNFINILILTSLLSIVVQVPYIIKGGKIK